MGKVRISGVKDLQGKEIRSNQGSKDANVPIFNRFNTISGEEDGVQNRFEKQGQTEYMNNDSAGKKTCLNEPLGEDSG